MNNNKIQIMKFLILILSICTFNCIQAQTFSGVIVDFNTNEPIPFATVYFSGTTVGTSADVNGNYSITKPDNVETSLIYRIVGYASQSIKNPTITNTKIIRLKVAIGQLDAIVLNAKEDPWNRRIKELEFLKYFLGETEYARNAKVLNLSKIKLRFNPTSNQLTAYCDEPILIKHPYLGYLISYDLEEFEIDYTVNNSIKNPSPTDYYATNSFLNGSAFFENTESSSKQTRRVERRRQDLFEISDIALFKSIINQTTKDAGFYLIQDRRSVTFNSQIQIDDKHSIFRLTFKEKEYRLMDKYKNTSIIKLNNPNIEVSPFYHIISSKNISFGGFLGKLKATGILPLDYSPKNNLAEEE